MPLCQQQYRRPLPYHRTMITQRLILAACATVQNRSDHNATGEPQCQQSYPRQLPYPRTIIAQGTSWSPAQRIGRGNAIARATSRGAAAHASGSGDGAKGAPGANASLCPPAAAPLPVSLRAPTAQRVRSPLLSEPADRVMPSMVDSSRSPAGTCAAGDIDGQSMATPRRFASAIATS